MPASRRPIVTEVPRARLNQVAAAKLASLSVVVNLADDGETLQGELPLGGGKVRHPSTGARVTRVSFRVCGHDHLQLGDGPFSGLPPIRFYDLDRLDALEDRISEAVRGMQAGARPSPVARADRPQSCLCAVPAPSDALSPLVLAKKFAGATFSPGADVEVQQEFELKGARFRFTASHEQGDIFKGRLVGPTGEKWGERFDVNRFPGVRELVAMVLGVDDESPAPVAAGGATHAHATEQSAVPEHLIPHVGEVWVMNVLVEQATPSEVRYTCVNIDGNPYGAARVLKAADFESVFTQEKGGWRLPILIENVSGSEVVYRQLDRQRQPRGAQKKLATSILVNNFVPEAAAY